MTDKNLLQFAKENWDEYKISIANASKNTKGKALIESDIEVYNFDEICAKLFSPANKPTSADGMLFLRNNIYIMEFKSGFKQKITKDKFDMEEGKCEKLNEVCSKYWKLFWENQDRKIRELVSSIRLKAIESYLVLEKHLLPVCSNVKNQKNNKIVFLAIVDADEIDYMEDTLAELSKAKTVKDNSVNSIKQALRRLVNKKDCNNHSYLYDSIEVLTVKEFESWMKTIA